jgi:copper resistance protein B
MKSYLLLIGVAPLVLTVPTNAQSMQNMPGMSMPAMQARKPAVGATIPARRKPPRRHPQAHKPASRPIVPARRDVVATPKAPAHDMSGMGEMPGMAMPGTNAAQKPVSGADSHAGHDMSSMPGMENAQIPDSTMNHDMSGMQMPQSGSGQLMRQNMSSMSGMAMDGKMAVGTGGTSLAPGNAPAPGPPSDHYADRIYQNGAMGASRAMLHNEHGGGAFSMILFNLAEYQVRDGRDGYRWDGEAWFGKDLNRLAIKTEGEGAFHEGVDSAEIQAVYSRALDPYWNIQAGVRYDFKPNPSRTYATIGIEGVAPYWFETEAALFLSNKGEVLGRVGGYYDQRITQRLILQPRIEVNLAAQNVPQTRIGAGISNAELGLRLRYEIKREFAPYIGVSYDRKLGQTAGYARADGKDIEARSFVIGVRAWF